MFFNLFLFFFLFLLALENMSDDEGMELVRLAHSRGLPYTTASLVKIAINEKDDAKLLEHNIATRWWAVRQLKKDSRYNSKTFARYNLSTGSFNGWSTKNWPRLTLERCHGFHPNDLAPLRLELIKKREDYVPEEELNE